MDDTANDWPPTGPGFQNERTYGSLRTLMVRALAEAQKRGAPAVEAEHLLLAVAADTRGPATAVMTDAGLDYAGIVAALRAERVASLAVAGIAPVAEERLVSTPGTTRPGWSASVREALVRGTRGPRMTGAHGAQRGMQRGVPRGGVRGTNQRGTTQRGINPRGHRRADEVDLVIGILGADLGTIPRALAIAGIDRDTLIDRLQQL